MPSMDLSQHTQEIEHHLCNRNWKHFGQAHGTFPTISPFSEWVDWGAASHTADLILEGKFDNQGTTTLEQALTCHMQKRTDLDVIPNTITTAEWTNKIRSWPETTSTSLSGCHLTHSKTLIAPHSLDKTDLKYEELEHQ